MTRIEAAKIVLMLTAAYPTWRPTDESVQLYIQLLEPFEADIAKGVVMEILYSPREFAPPIGVLAEAIAINRIKAAGQYLSPEEAWAQVQDQIRYVGYYRKPTFGSPALTRAVQAMDWGDICTNENVEATRAHLMRIFGAMQSSQVREGVRALVGGPLASELSPREAQQITLGNAERVKDLVAATLAKMTTKKED